MTLSFNFLSRLVKFHDFYFNVPYENSDNTFYMPTIMRVKKPYNLVIEVLNKDKK